MVTALLIAAALAQPQWGPGVYPPGTQRPNDLVRSAVSVGSAPDAQREPQQIFSFNATSPDVGALTPVLSFDGIDRSPEFRFYGGEATISGWPGGGFGDSLVAAGAGTDPTFDRETPFGADTGVRGGGGEYYEESAASLGQVDANDDFIIELVFQGSGAGGSEIIASTKDGNDVGWRVITSADTSVVFQLEDSDLVQVQCTVAISSGTWNHVMFFMDRDEATTDGIIGVANGVEGCGANPSGLDKTLVAGTPVKLTLHDQATGGTLDFEGTTAYLAAWKHDDLFGTSEDPEWVAVALARMEALAGVSVIGSSAHSWTRADAATQTIDGYTFSMGDHWPRVEPAGLLVEDDSTNLFTDSIGFASAWTEVTGTDTTTDAAGVSPDLFSNATALRADGTTAEHGVTLGAALAGTQTYTFSVYAKAGDQTHLYLEDETVTHSAYFDLSDCTVDTTDTVIETFAESLSDSWCRVGFSFAGTAATHTMAVQSASGDGGKSFSDGDGDDDTLIFGAQVEDYEHPTSYIQAAGGTEARVDDDFTGTVAETWPATSLEVVFTVPSHNQTAAARYQFEYIDDASLRSGFRTTSGDNVRITHTGGGGSGVVTGTGDVVDGTQHMVRATLELNSLILYVDGPEDGTPDLAVDPSPGEYVKYGLGQRANADQFQGWLKSAYVWNGVAF